MEKLVEGEFLGFIFLKNWKKKKQEIWTVIFLIFGVSENPTLPKDTIFYFLVFLWQLGPQILQLGHS